MVLPFGLGGIGGTVYQQAAEDLRLLGANTTSVYNYVKSHPPPLR